ncbi:MAG: biosis protein MshP [Betaproteobacteria bacterium]|jgi:MSHA biogenesis protein MshP|nr:biosis protein MshP [Betaproteobacteria bacterium]
MPDRLKKQFGLGAVAALFVLVVLSVMGAAIARLGWSQQIGSVQDMEGARAQRAANSGAEWGLFQALTAAGIWRNCNGATQTLTGMRADLGMNVTVTCNSTVYIEGQTGTGATPVFTDVPVRVYRIDAVACNASNDTMTCPDAARVGSIGYIERRRQVQATDR